MAAQSRPFVFEETPFDAAIYAGERQWPGTDGMFLMRENLAAVCKPGMVPNSSLREADWARYTLLQQSTRPYVWRQWLAAQGLRVEGELHADRGSHSGLGDCSRTAVFLVEDEVRRGLLTEAGGRFYWSGQSYYLVYPERKSETASLAAFSAWLDGMARRYRNEAGLD